MKILILIASFIGASLAFYNQYGKSFPILVLSSYLLQTETEHSSVQCCTNVFYGIFLVYSMCTIRRFIKNILNGRLSSRSINVRPKLDQI